MKLQKIYKRQLMIGNLINCLAILIGLIFYCNNIKLNYIIVISIFIILLIINVFLFITRTKERKYIKKDNRIELFEEIIESAPNAVFVHRKLKFIYLNKKAAEIFGYKDPSEIIGRNVEDFVKFNIDVIGEERYDAVKEGRYFEPIIEEMFFRENGQVIDMEIHGRSIEVKGKNYALVICENVTEKKKILELEEKVNLEEKKLREKIEHEKLKDEFFSNLSHELRTPLTIILASIQLLENTAQELGHKNNKSFKALKQNGYRLLRLINNLLDITKIDSGYFDIKMDKHNIVSVVEDITSSVVDYIENKGLNIEFDTEVEEIMVCCHLDSMDRIILNLLSNAVKFTPEGGSIFVHIFDEGDNVKIVIKDTGIGIEEENIDLIFNRFRQVDKSFTRTHEGSGIGLSIVKSLVEMQEGTISLKSEYGKGSEFKLKLPVCKACSSEKLNILMEKDDYIKEKINIEFSDI
ncbi:PAS domain-containing sensor histidine kinase [Oceanirhabdus sp. W0125-5]|uniref:PAS domain-containing sensor histidine kinase n=1 Tax=Oceanirhabdus sp. W0125-5 TaxID=2999116 RepID=UPI0022F325CD|nr:PAS domain-containing sensor histidine kinase [Oceanirhabdus sp. W0125-5]WBW97030.1 PAS domain-containing sensor histidine kinase [Oceanirhabdus sp. W0125-5]